jgi:hypothetical protein
MVSVIVWSLDDCDSVLPDGNAIERSVVHRSVARFSLRRARRVEDLMV